MIEVNLTATAVFANAIDLVKTFQAPVAETDELGNDRIIPLELRRWLARLRLLEGVPFAYLAADSELLPPESIRFFYVDRRYTDALVEGALSVGTANTSDRAEMEQLYPQIRDEIDEEERYVRMPGGELPPDRVSETVTGMLLRSRAVSGWPGLHVRAYGAGFQAADDAIVPDDDPHRLYMLRLERLAPAVLLALFDGIPAAVHIEEPRHGIQFGVRFDSLGDPSTLQPWIPARDGTTGLDVQPLDRVSVPCRPGSPGVLDMRRMDERLRNDLKTKMGTEVDAGENALQLLRFPYRQVFGNPPGQGVPDPDPFRPTPTLRIADLEVAFQRGVQ
ncbi:MAG TPA: hypothetical protein VGJ03_11705 [Acidimicrobiales bacterium]